MHSAFVHTATGTPLIVSLVFFLCFLWILRGECVFSLPSVSVQHGVFSTGGDWWQPADLWHLCSHITGTADWWEDHAVRHSAVLGAWWTCPLSQGCCWTLISSWLWITWPGCCWRRRTAESGLFMLNVCSSVDFWCCSSVFNDRRMHG